MEAKMKQTKSVAQEATQTETIERLQGTFGELRLKFWAQVFRKDMEELKPQERSVLLTHLHRWAETEVAGRKTALINSRIKSAKFKRSQTIDGFDFNHSKATQSIEKAYMRLHNSVSLTSLPCAIFSGNAGLGKTHLARALGFAACQKGLSAKFLTAAEMVNHLAHAQRTFDLEKELNKYRKPQVLIIDELGYVSLDTQASNLFFQVISTRHDLKLGTVATTNLPFGKFNQIFANDAIAHAIVDRLVNDAEVFYLEGESYRKHQKEMRKKRGK